MNKKTILCYGDSNTHGTKPMSDLRTSDRYNENERWTGILARQLGDHYTIIEEGLPARTTVHNDPIEGIHKNGLTYLRPCLESHLPIDIIVLMLGTNDLKTRFSVTPTDIASSIDVLLTEIEACKAGPNQICPKLIVVCPPPIQETGIFEDVFGGGSEKSKQLAPLYQQIAENHKATFLDIGSVVTVSKIDGLHYNKDQHEKLAQAIRQIIEKI